MTNGNGKWPLPEGWVWTEIGNVLSIRNGYAFNSKDYSDSGTLLVRQTNLSGDKVDINKAVFLPEHYQERYKAFVVQKIV
ncbi:MAG TPA: hypothetical protein PK205_10675 [Promineifilum sp.]|nr:hypothetical protein [Promineifilum sp.]